MLGGARPAGARVIEPWPVSQGVQGEQAGCTLVHFIMHTRNNKGVLSWKPGLKEIIDTDFPHFLKVEHSCENFYKLKWCE